MHEICTRGSALIAPAASALRAQLLHGLGCLADLQTHPLVILEGRPEGCSSIPSKQHISSFLYRMSTMFTWKNIPTIRDGYRVPCGLLPISTLTFPIYFPSSNYYYQFLGVLPEYCLQKQNSIIRVSIRQSMTQNSHDVSVYIEEEDFEMTKKTTQICHFPMMVLLAPSPKENFITNPLQ